MALTEHPEVLLLEVLLLAMPLLSTELPPALNGRRLVELRQVEQART